MIPTKIKTSSESRSEWQGRIIQSQAGLEVILDGKELAAANCPAIDSLKRRHQASDQSWLKDWLRDDADPTLPD
ncbi:MAG: hypothetical protein IT445_08225 [Phycisphaeraceae bacterium]|nr:hypothetical protein [Phycisphaeraceae bacterium]